MLNFIKTAEPFSKMLYFAEKTVSLHAMITSCGYSIERDKAYRWAGTERGDSPFVIFQYTLSGRGRLSYEGTATDLVPGTAMLVAIPHQHVYELPEGADHWAFIYLCMHGSEVMRMTRQIHLISGPVIALGAASPVIGTAGEILQAALRDQVKTPFQASLYAYPFFMRLLHELSRCRSGPQRPQDIERAVCYFHENFSAPVQVSHLARAAGLSRYHFSRLFRKICGETPAAWLQEQRLQLAITLLHEPGLGLEEVAVRSGFANANYFGKMFRKAFGISPGVFRTRG